MSTQDRFNRVGPPPPVRQQMDVPQRDAVLDELRGLLQGRVCVLGVGNRYRRDDAAGSLLAEALADTTGALVIDAGTVPENYLEKVARTDPDGILIIDAADFGAAPGAVRTLHPQGIAAMGLSTHALSLSMTAEFLTTRTGARVTVLAIQPDTVGDGKGLSEPVSRAVAWLRSTLPAILAESAR